MSKSVWKIRPDGKTVRRQKGRIEGPFVPLLKDTLKAPAWKALSYGARSLYVVLKARYNNNLMNAVYVSTRIAANELGAAKNRRDVRQWFDELEYYGFIVKVRLAHHGVNSHGKAPHWRLTDVKYLSKEPARDFLQWDGKAFAEKSRPPRFHTIKNKTRGTNAGASVAPMRVPVVPKVPAKMGTSGTNAGAISGDGTGTNAGAITSKPLARAKAELVRQQQPAPEPAPVNAPADDEIPTFLRRGHPDCPFK